MYSMAMERHKQVNSSIVSQSAMRFPALASSPDRYDRYVVVHPCPLELVFKSRLRLVMCLWNASIMDVTLCTSPL